MRCVVPICDSEGRSVRRGLMISTRLRSLCLLVLGPWLLLSFNANADTESAGGLQVIQESATANDQNARVTMLEPLSRHPEYSELAHWHLGQVRSGNTWLSTEEYAKQRANDPQLTEYLARRSEVEQGQKSELGLAGWCRRQGMHDAERVHLHNVVRSSKASAEDRMKAMKRLDLKVYQGQLRTRKQVAAIEKGLQEERQQEAKWSPKVERWIEAIESGEGRKRRYALAELREVKDADAILTLEKLISYRSEPFAKEFVAILQAMTDDRSTAALVRQSVDSPWEPVRLSAVKALKDRPLHDHTPRLLDELNSPVESRFRVGIDSDGMVRRSHQLYREDQNEKHVATITNARGPERVNRALAFGPRDGRMRFAPVEQAVAPRPRARRRGADYTKEEIDQLKANYGRERRMAFARQVIAQQEAVRALQLQAEVSMMNELVKQRNELVFSALQATTGQGTVPSTTVSWWDWWDEYNDRYREQKPVYTHVASRSDPLQITYVPIDCFPEGTLVHTELGLKPIELVRAGDRVLSQDVDSGELTYKMVVRRTVRPPGEILNVHLSNGESVQTTKGHPFWVNNIGWRMAKRLTPNHHVHSVTGNGRVVKVEPNGEQLPAINLIVADFGTFFVGKQGLLVHGSPQRKATTAVVPGVRAEQLQAEL